MPDVIINVTPQSTASVEVDVDNVASYYYDLAKQWAISDSLVEQLDYSSKYYANLSSTSATTAQNAADSILNNAGFIAVSQDLVNIDTVANSITNVNTVATDISNVNAVYADLSNIDSVAGDLTNIDSVANDLVNINAVNNNKTNIDTVANDLTNIDTNATYISNINTVASSITNVNNVSGDISNVNAVAGDLTNIDTVKNNLTDINTCSTNIADINTCAANISTLSAKVDKAGDTMTGDLTIQKSTYTAYSSSYDEGGKLFVKDKNDNNVGTFAIFSNTSNNYAQMSLYDGNSSSAWFGINKSSAINSDGVNASSGVKQSITNWAYPSSQNTNYTLQTTGTSYTATANGYICITATQNSTSGYVMITNTTNSLQTMGQPPNVSNYQIKLFLPVAKGDNFTVNYSGVNTSTLTFKLIQAIGG